MPHKETVILVANSSWYLYNFRRGTLLSLRDAGFRVIGLAPQDDYSRCLEEELGVEHWSLRLEGKSTRMLGEGKSLLALVAALRRAKPIFVLNFTIKANIYSGLACRVLGIPYANNVSGLGTTFLHDSWLFRRVRSLYGFVNRGARRVFFQNREDHLLFREQGLLRDTPTTILPGSGVDTVHFDYSPLSRHPPFTFVMIARLLGDKGVREYVRAAEQVKARHPDTRFLLLGPLGVSNRSAIDESEVRSWQDAGIVEYQGEQRDVRPWLKQAQVLVLPSYSEGMPRTVLEAAAMGRPAIVSDVPGCRQSVVAGETGWLCDVQSVESLAGRMCECLAMSSEDLQQAGTAARRRIEEEFDERLVIATVMQLLEIGDSPWKSGTVPHKRGQSPS